ncbi:MAG: ABC transporter ATP-binding protein/permease [Bacilli bacterium]|nr:ABC transporter ATP-binding protein/permease [Bacilli bacterium]MDD4076471.1 ABC transporter ATP-binding protein [Bacilli bacterium]MDD4387807.1 ABC transporter ATP-binding protein [Bacilli bacterium]
MNRGPGRGGPRGRFAYFEMPKEKHIQKKVIKRIWSYLKHYPSSIFFITFAILLYALFSLSLPHIIRIVIDDYINVESVNFIAIVLIIGSVIIITVAMSIGSWFQRVLMATVATKVAKDIRRDAFIQLQQLPIKYYDKNSHGKIMSILTNDIETIFNALAQIVPQFISAIILIIGAIISMLYTSWQLTLVVILLLPIALFLIIFITSKAFKYFRNQQIQLGEVNGIVQENIMGLKVVKLYNQEKAMIEKFNQSNTELEKASYQAGVYSGLMMPIIRLLDNILYSLVITVGGILKIVYQAVTVGQIQAITNFARMFVRPISNIAQIYNLLQAAIAGGYRVFNLIDEKSEYINDSDLELESVSGQVEFSHVYFGYEPNQTVLKDINFKVDSGNTIAIVGPTGSGKTTIINLLARYYDIEQGNILIDGKSIYDYSKKSLRLKIGIVLQSTYLFNGSVLDNIKYGKPDATFKEVVEAAKLAQVHEIIERLPHKYNTRVQEGGINFSHGERQLISIARTILSNPAILVLDEATSSVDTRTEAKIQKSIGLLVKNRTSFIIAHRLKTIKNADHILVILDGRIVEAGNHQELMERQGVYAEMYNLQFGEIQ